MGETISCIVSAGERVKDALVRCTGRCALRVDSPAATAAVRRPVTTALALSLFVHAAVVGAALVFCAGGRPLPLNDGMIRVLLVDDVPSGASRGGKAGAQVHVMAAAAGIPRQAAKAAGPKKTERLISTRPVPSPAPLPPAPKEAASEQPAPVRDAPPATGPMPLTTARLGGLGASGGSDKGEGGGGTGGASGRGAGQGTGAGAGSGQGTGAGGSGTGSGQTAYMREHFVYIRDLIMKHLKYPPAARRLGWKGAVTVSFVVLENGLAGDIKIVKSSGHDMLDQAVVRTIQQIQPFPKPPAKAELTVPIVFRLEAGLG